MGCRGFSAFRGCRGCREVVNGLYIEYCYMNNRRPLLPKPKSGQL